MPRFDYLTLGYAAAVFLVVLAGYWLFASHHPNFMRFKFKHFDIDLNWPIIIALAYGALAYVANHFYGYKIKADLVTWVLLIVLTVFLSVKDKDMSEPRLPMNRFVKLLLWLIVIYIGYRLWRIYPLF